MNYYNEVNINLLFKALINKYFNIRFYKRVYISIKEDIELYKLYEIYLNLNDDL